MWYIQILYLKGFCNTFSSLLRDTADRYTTLLGTCETNIISQHADRNLQLVVKVTWISFPLFSTNHDLPKWPHQIHDYWLSCHHEQHSYGCCRRRPPHARTSTKDYENKRRGMFEGKKKRVFKVMICTWHNFFSYTIPLCLAFRLLVRTREERKQPQPAKSLQLDSYLIDFKFCGGWFERRQTPLMEPFDGYSEKCCRRPSELIQPFTTRKLSPKFLRSQTSSAYNMKSLNFVKFADECSQIIKQHWTYKETASWSD